MEKRKAQSARGTLLLIAILFGAAIVGIFVNNQIHMGTTLVQMETERLSESLDNYQRQLCVRIDALFDKAQTTALMIANGVAPDSVQWALLGGKEYQVEYRTLPELTDGIFTEEEVKALSGGRSMISEVFFEPDEEKGKICIAVPVSHSRGAVCVLFAADTLSNESGFFLTDSKGDFIPFTRTAQQNPNNSIFNMQNIRAQEQARLLENLQGGDGTVCQYTDKDKNTALFCARSLGYRDWRLVSAGNTTEGDAVAAIQISALRGVALLAMLLFPLTGVLIGALYFQRRKALMETQRYSLLEKFSDTLLFEYDYRTDRMFWSKNACAVFSIPQAELSHYEARQTRRAYVHPEDVEKLAQFKQDRPPEGTTRYGEPIRFLRRNGTYAWCECQYQMLYGKKQEPLFFIGKVVDITGRPGREQALQHLSDIDSLTGLLNLDAMTLALSERTNAESGFLFLLDIDDFKQINDSLGHAAGNDRLLRMTETLREETGEGSLLARTGGDEFAIFLSGLTSEDAAVSFAKRLLSCASKIGAVPSNGSSLSISIGIVRCKPDDTNGELLLEQAVEALRRAQTKDVRYAFCDPTMSI